MSGKTDTEVVIGGKVYKLSGYESREYIQKVASYLNSKIQELEQTEGYSRMTLDNKALLLELNIADDYFKTKESADKTDRDIDNRDKEIYDLKHELITLQRKTDEMEKEAKQIAAKNKELLLQKSKLESALEAALLGEVHSVKPGKEEEEPESVTEPERIVLKTETVPERVVLKTETVPERVVLKTETVPERVVLKAESEPERVILKAESEPERVILKAESGSDGKGYRQGKEKKIK